MSNAVVGSFPDASASSAAPLERRLIKIQGSNGVQQEVPALHRRWSVPDRPWMPLLPPPPPGASRPQVESWLAGAAAVREDLDFLLGLECHRFWSQLLHDDALHRRLEAALQTLPRPHDVARQDNGGDGVNAEVAVALDRVADGLFRVFLRMSTRKESADNFFTPSAFGDLLYDNFLLDVPKLMDMCTLFRPWAKELVDKMVGNVFSCQPKFKDDFRLSLETISAALNSAADRTEVLTRFSNCDLPEQQEELLELVSYSTDVSVSMATLVESHPALAEVLHSFAFPSQLAAFYQQVLMPLTRFVHKQTLAGFVQPADQSRLCNSLSLSRRSCVVLLRMVVQVCCLGSSLEKGGTGHLDQYLELFSSCLSEGGAILVDYNRSHALSDDVEMLGQAGGGGGVDETRVAYVLDGVRRVEADMLEGADKAEAKRVLELESQSQSQTGKPRTTDTESGACASSEAPPALDSLISQVRDLLPDLGEGFVQACLEYFDNQPESVINSILEENLPPHLIELDRSLPRKTTQRSPPVEQKSSTDVQAAARSVLKPRSNVFDGDEFDVATRDHIDVSRVHQGKRNKGSSANKMLDNKEELQAIRHKFQDLGMVAEFEELDYDDEYDDTYDDNAVGQSEPDAKDELTERRPFVLPRALGGGHVDNRRPAQDDEDDDGEEDADRKDHFVRNPEDVRAEAERRRQSRAARGGGGGGGGGGGAQRKPGGGEEAKKRDVVGKPKGQGQEKSVLINRARKNTNKGKSHRAAADRKQAKGMF